MLRGVTFSERTDFHEDWEYRGDANIGYLELARADGLEEADFDDPSFLGDYISHAFEYCHREDVEDALIMSSESFRRTGDLLSALAALNALYSERVKPPEQVVELARALSAEIIRYLSKHPHELYNLRPRQFEELVAEVLASYGWELELTPATRDGGYDIYAIAPTGVPSVASHWIIECKKYAAEHRVGVELVRALYGVKADLMIGSAMLATTSRGFTRGAEAFKASKYDLELRSYRDILEWINNYKPNANGQLYIKDNRVILY
jgi:Restriction endonuclease.